MLNYKAEPELHEPKLFFIVLQALAQGNLRLWHNAVAAFNLAEAQEKAIQLLEKENPDLYQQGVQLGGWKLQGHLMIEVMQLDRMLEQSYGERDDVAKEKERKEINALMQTIIDTASRKLLRKYEDRFTEAEVAYLEDEINKYERTT